MPVPLVRAAEDLGALPKVADPLERVAPLEVMRAPVGPGIFLYPKEAAVEGRPIPEGGFFPSSPLLFPASDGERWIAAELLEGTLDFSEALMSSVLPGVLSAEVLLLVLGGVMPTWADMPLLSDPVCDICPSVVTFGVASSYWF